MSQVHLVELMQVQDELELLYDETDKYRRMIELLCDRMIVDNNLDEFKDDHDHVLHHWKILGSDCEWHEFDGLTRKEAEIVWRELWCLDQN